MIIKSRFSHQATLESRLEMEYLRKKISRKSENQASHVVILKSARNTSTMERLAEWEGKSLSQIDNSIISSGLIHYENIFFAAFD